MTHWEKKTMLDLIENQISFLLQLHNEIAKGYDREENALTNPETDGKVIYFPQSGQEKQA